MAFTLCRCLDVPGNEAENTNQTKRRIEQIKTSGFYILNWFFLIHRYICRPKTLFLSGRTGESVISGINCSQTN